MGRLGERLRILSANLANGRADPDAFAALLRARRPDVVAAQEVAPEQAETLAAMLPHGCLEAARDHTGMGFELRAPGRTERLALPCRDARIAHLELQRCRLGSTMRPGEVRPHPLERALVGPK